MRTRLRYDRVDIDLHLHLGHGEPFDDEARGHGRNAFEIAPNHVIHGHTIGAIRNIRRHFAHVLEARSGLFKQLLDVLHGLFGLRGRILGGHQGLVEIESGLTT